MFRLHDVEIDSRSAGDNVKRREDWKRVPALSGRRGSGPVTSRVAKRSQS